MNGVHDMGGMHGFGAVVPEPNEPVFHASWERQALAITLAMGATGHWNLDQSRQARERLPAARYLGSSYYQIWLEALQVLMLQHGLVTEHELASGQAQAAPVPGVRPLAAARVRTVLAQGSPVVRPAQQPARYAVGQAVRARVMHPAGHTRLPAYVRGKSGVIARVHGVHVFADSHAQPDGAEAPQWLYSVRFEAQQLWGEHAEPNSSVCVDAWASYLEPA
jgi:nitrile hydratase beta subunit